MSPISFNANASNASANYTRAMQSQGGIERGGDLSRAPQGIRAKVFQPAKASTPSRDLRAAAVFFVIVFVATFAAMALHII